MYATFSISDRYKGPCANKDMAMGMEGANMIYNSYYQWVPIFLVCLAVFFYLPRMLWLMMEGGLMKFFGKGTTTRVIEDPEEKRDKLVEVRKLYTPGGKDVLTGFLKFPQFFRKNIHNKYNVSTL